MRTATIAPFSKPSAPGVATAANTNENAARITTGTRGTSIWRAGMCAISASTTTASAHAAIPHQLCTKKMPIEYASSSTIFRRASQRCTRVSPSQYANPLKPIRPV